MYIQRADMASRSAVHSSGQLAQHSLLRARASEARARVGGGGAAEAAGQAKGSNVNSWSGQ